MIYYSDKNVVISHDTKTAKFSITPSLEDISIIIVDNTIVAQGLIITGLECSQFKLEYSQIKTPGFYAELNVVTHRAHSGKVYPIEFLKAPDKREPTYGPRGKTGFSKNPYRRGY